MLINAMGAFQSFPSHEPDGPEGLASNEYLWFCDIKMYLISLMGMRRGKIAFVEIFLVAAEFSLSSCFGAVGKPLKRWPGDIQGP
jgi:hypothetical protein